MKLITYNFLTSKCIRGVKVGYPLKLNVSCDLVNETKLYVLDYVNKLNEFIRSPTKKQ